MENSTYESTVTTKDMSLLVREGTTEQENRLAGTEQLENNSSINNQDIEDLEDPWRLQTASESDKSDYEDISKDDDSLSEESVELSVPISDSLSSISDEFPAMVQDLRPYNIETPPSSDTSLDLPDDFQDPHQNYDGQDYEWPNEDSADNRHVSPKNQLSPVMKQILDNLPKRMDERFEDLERFRMDWHSCYNHSSERLNSRSDACSSSFYQPWEESDYLQKALDSCVYSNVGKRRPLRQNHVLQRSIHRCDCERENSSSPVVPSSDDGSYSTSGDYCLTPFDTWWLTHTRTPSETTLSYYEDCLSDEENYSCKV